MNESKYLEFDRIGWTGKTGVWNVLSKSHGFILGQIKWFGRWRQYCFWPSPNTIFNPECMGDISGFIREKMRERGHG